MPVPFLMKNIFTRPWPILPWAFLVLQTNFASPIKPVTSRHHVLQEPSNSRGTILGRTQ